MKNESYNSGGRLLAGENGANTDTEWIMDGENDGYPYPVGTDPTEFTEFEKDEDGYPKNWGVWKLDDQNDGYPWIVGYLPVAARKGDIVKIMQNGVWSDTAGCMVFENGEAKDAFLKAKRSVSV